MKLSRACLPLALAAPVLGLLFAIDAAPYLAMAQFARHGHCSSRDFRPEIEAVAVPFTQPVDAIRFVLNCGVLAPQALPARKVLALGSALIELVHELEAALAV